MDGSVFMPPNRPESVTPVKRERATFAFGAEPKRDDGLRQIEPDAALRQWSANLPRIGAGYAHGSRAARGSLSAPSEASA